MPKLEYFTPLEPDFEFNIVRVKYFTNSEFAVLHKNNEVLTFANPENY